MCDPVDKYEILKSYFPKDSNWWIDLDWHDKGPNQPEKIIKVEFDKWLEWALKENTYTDALNRLKKIKGKRSEKEFDELVWHVHSVSFSATPLNSKIKLNIKETFEDQKDNLQNIQSQILAIEKLRGLIKKQQGTPYDPLALLVTREEFFDIDNIPREVLEYNWPHSDRDWFSFPFELFDKGLEIYLKRLKSNLTEDPSGENLVESMLAKKWGALIYPGNLTPQAKRKSAEINSLLFNLVFLFRQFTSDQSNKEFLKFTRGHMPDLGSPCYENVADISNSILFAGNIISEEDEGLDSTKVMERVRNLTSQGVQLGSWFGLGF